MGTTGEPVRFDEYEKLDYARVPAGAKFFTMLDEVYSAELAEYAARRPKWVSSVEFRVLAADWFDAVAVPDPSGFAHLIGINLGAVLFLQDFLGAILAHPQLLTDVGNPACETAPIRYSIARAAYQLIDPDNPDQITVPRYSPVNPLRQAYANLLLQIALDFIFFHEMTHVIAGHTHCRLAYGLAPSFSAARPLHLANESDALRMQALETDADWFAIGTVARLSLDGTGLAAGSDWMNLDQRQRIRAFCLATLLVFVLCDSSDKGWESCKTSDHPNSLVRQVSMDPILRHHLCEVEGLAEDVVVGAYMQAVNDVVAMGHHLFVPVSIARFDPVTGAAIEDWLGQVITEQNKLRGYLMSTGFDKRFAK